MLKLKKIRVQIAGEAPEWEVNASADLIVCPEDHSDFEKRKGLAIELTTQQETMIKNFVKDVVLPQVNLEE